MDKGNPLLAAALAYAARGWYVFPVYEATGSVCACGNPQCEQPAKHPRTVHGLLEATTNESKIRTWWRRSPQANIGVATEPSYLVVPDVDPRNNGDISFEALRSQLEESTFETLRHLTGGGGVHYIFHASSEIVKAIASRSDAFGDAYHGIDIKARGGYFIAPPSSHIAGQRYEKELSSPVEPAEIPPRLAQMLIQPRQSKVLGVGDNAPIRKGRRNTRLAALAGSLRRQGENMQAILHYLRDVNQRRCKPPLEEHELRRIASSVSRYSPAVNATGIKAETSASVVSDDSSGLDIVCLADVEPEQVEWVWFRRVPLAKVTLLVGDPGAGKSFASLAVAAPITNGTSLPDDASPRARGSVLLWNGEDGIEDTIRVRAETVGVDLEKLHVIRGGFNEAGQPRPFSLADVHHLGSEIERLGDVRMVVIDPVSVLLAGVDTHVDAAVRSTLQPLVELARSARVAVVVVLHLKKGEAERIVYRVGGSIGFVALARSVLLVAADQDGRPAIAPVKSNLCAAPRPIEFRIDDEGRWWWGTVNDDLSAEHLLSVTRVERGTALSEAIDFFDQALANGDRDASEIRAEADALGIAEKTQERARKKLGVKPRRIGGIGKAGKWVLSLPKSAKNATATSDVLSVLSGESESIPSASWDGAIRSDADVDSAFDHASGIGLIHNNASPKGDPQVGFWDGAA